MSDYKETTEQKSNAKSLVDSIPNDDLETIRTRELYDLLQKIKDYYQVLLHDQGFAIVIFCRINEIMDDVLHFEYDCELSDALGYLMVNFVECYEGYQRICCYSFLSIIW